MHKLDFTSLTVLIATVASLVVVSADENETAPGRWNWQETQAGIDPKGDLNWKPHPFALEKGSFIRYIDFEAGNDASLSSFY